MIDNMIDKIGYMFVSGNIILSIGKWFSLLSISNISILLTLTCTIVFYIFKITNENKQRRILNKSMEELGLFKSKKKEIKKTDNVKKNSTIR